MKIILRKNWLPALQLVGLNVPWVQNAAHTVQCTGLRKQRYQLPRLRNNSYVTLYIRHLRNIMYSLHHQKVDSCRIEQCLISLYIWSCSWRRGGKTTFFQRAEMRFVIHICLLNYPICAPEWHVNSFWIRLWFHRIIYAQKCFNPLWPRHHGV